MSSLCAASSTVLPLATATAWPSTSRFNILVSDIAGNQTLLVIDVVLEFIAKMLNEALDRQRGGVSQRAYGAAGDVSDTEISKSRSSFLPCPCSMRLTSRPCHPVP